MGMREMSLREARAKLGELVEAAHHGEAVVLTKHGRPYARIAPMMEETMPELRDSQRQAAHEQMLAATAQLDEDPAQVGDATVTALGVLLGGLIGSSRDGLGRDYAGDLAEIIRAGLEEACQMHAPDDFAEQTRLSRQAWEKVHEAAGTALASIAKWEQAQTGPTPRVVILISAMSGDSVPGVEVSDPECPIDIRDYPEAMTWASAQGWNYEDSDELVYVADADDGIPGGFPTLRLEI